jgi:hypothetical protein
MSGWRRFTGLDDEGDAGDDLAHPLGREGAHTLAELGSVQGVDL